MVLLSNTGLPVQWWFLFMSERCMHLRQRIFWCTFLMDLQTMVYLDIFSPGEENVVLFLYSWQAYECFPLKSFPLLWTRAKHMPCNILLIYFFSYGNVPNKCSHLKGANTIKVINSFQWILFYCKTTYLHSQFVENLKLIQIIVLMILDKLWILAHEIIRITLYYARGKLQPRVILWTKPSRLLCSL